YERENWINNLEYAVKNYPNAQIILDHQNEIPEPLLKLAGNDYSAIDFVAKTIDPSIENDYEYPSNINGGKYPYYIQWDNRWGFENYAKGIIGYTGCGPTSAAMIISGLLKDDSITPDVIAKVSEENGFSNANGTSWGLYPFLGQKYGLQVEQITPEYDYLKAHLDTGNPALVSVGPGHFTSQGHVMVIVGTDFFGRLIINDPNNRENSESRWKWDEFQPQIKTIWTVKP
ncbi:MAG: C39 family peptidase, partial [Tissierellia bacterium]|nr:C39 family peptidase [Tissierellia bacterium]